MSDYGSAFEMNCLHCGRKMQDQPPMFCGEACEVANTIMRIESLAHKIENLKSELGGHPKTCLNNAQEELTLAIEHYKFFGRSYRVLK